MLPFCSTSYSRPGPLCLFGYLLVGGSLTPEFFTDGRRSEWLYLFLKSHLYLGLLCFFFLFFLLLGSKSSGKGQQKSQQKERPPVHDVSLLSSWCVLFAWLSFVCSWVIQMVRLKSKHPHAWSLCAPCAWGCLFVFTRYPREFRGCHKPPWRHTPDSPYRSSVWGRPSRS